MCHQFRNEKNFILKVSMRSHEPVRKNLPPNSLYKSQQERSSDTPKFGARKCCFVLVTKKKKKKCTSPSINELDGEVLSEYAWNLSHGADTYTPICCPSIDVRPFPAAAIASPFNWSRREHKLPPHWRPPAALLLSWTWSICPRFFSNKDLWTTGISDYSIVQPRMKQL